MKLNPKLSDSPYFTREAEMPPTLLECDALIGLGNEPYPFTKQMIIQLAPGLIRSIKGDRSKRLFGLPAPLVKGKKIAQFR